MQTILELSICYGLNVCVPPEIHVKILMPKVMVLIGGTFGRCLDHEGGTLMNAISGLIKRDSTETSGPLHHVRVQEEVWDVEESSYLTMLTP